MLFGNHVHFYDKVYLGKLVRAASLGFDVSFIGGGTLINKKGSLPLLDSIKSAKRVVFGAGVADPAFWNGVPAGYSDPGSWADYLNNVDYIAVRGPLSQRLLAQWGVRTPVKVIGDLALVFLEETVTRKRKTRCLGLNLGDTGGVLWGGSDAAFIEALLANVIHLCEEWWSVELFNVYDKDAETVESFAATMRHYGHGVRTHHIYHDVAAYFRSMAAVDVFVGEKLHSVILANCTSTPAVMLEYRPKCLDYMMSIGREDCCLRVDAVTERNVAELVQRLYADLDAYQDQLHRSCLACKESIISESRWVIDHIL